MVAGSNTGPAKCTQAQSSTDWTVHNASSQHVMVILNTHLLPGFDPQEASPTAPQNTESSVEQPASGAAQSDVEPPPLWPWLLIAFMFWFIFIGPERKNRKRRQAMLDNLSKGDEVMTTGGLYGRVTRMNEQEVVLTVADGVRLRFHRSAIQGLADEGDGGKGDKPSNKDTEQAPEEQELVKT